jgi:hypothetical protein
MAVTRRQPDLKVLPEAAHPLRGLAEDLDPLLEMTFPTGV